MSGRPPVLSRAGEGQGSLPGTSELSAAVAEMYQHAADLKAFLRKAPETPHCLHCEHIEGVFVERLNSCEVTIRSEVATVGALLEADVAGACEKLLKVAGGHRGESWKATLPPNATLADVKRHADNTLSKAPGEAIKGRCAALEKALACMSIVAYHYACVSCCAG